MKYILCDTMIQTANILKSKKRIGKYEKIIIEELNDHFLKLGYSVVPHARFDVAWGSIVSDIDLLMIKNNKLIMIEVKSSKDTLSRAKNQINAVEDFVDEAYVATNYLPRKWPSMKAGRIIVTSKGVEVIKEAKKLERRPKLNTLLSLRRESLLRLSSDTMIIHKNMKKYEIASQILKDNSKNLKLKLQEIVTCQ